MKRVFFFFTPIRGFKKGSFFLFFFFKLATFPNWLFLSPSTNFFFHIIPLTVSLCCARFLHSPIRSVLFPVSPAEVLLVISTFYFSSLSLATLVCLSAKGKRQWQMECVCAFSLSLSVLVCVCVCVSVSLGSSVASINLVSSDKQNPGIWKDSQFWLKSWVAVCELNEDAAICKWTETKRRNFTIASLWSFTTGQHLVPFPQFSAHMPQMFQNI